jgi:hypothetical protein
MRHTLLTISAGLALVVLASPVDAQVPLKFGAQGAVITSVDDFTTDQGMSGTFGLGGRVMLDPPLFPVGVIGSATYYFPDIDELTYWTATAAAQLRLPLPMVKPYILAGWQIRRTSDGIESGNEYGPVVGAGIQLDLGLSLFLEGTFEFNDEIEAAPDFDNNPLVIKGGVLFGG